MLKMNLFMFTVTLSLKKREMTGKEYEHQKRIHQLYKDVEMKRLEQFHWL